ncbi:hypothetical protein ANRL2_00212 [Anaerolineae bacterium]|nr:hypothetical protein ANRL2_00212 [Anaerolineae bacterium]
MTPKTQNDKRKTKKGSPAAPYFCVLSFAFCVAVAGCATPPPAIPHDEPLCVVEVKNLAGVPLKFPSMYFGDALGAAEALQVEKLDLAVLARAGLYSQLAGRGYAAKLERGGRWEIHAAFTHLNLEKLKSTGMVTLGLLVLVVDANAGTESARGEAIREFRLLDVAPDDGGSLGEGRFIEGRIKAFVEALALDALTAAGIE